MRSDGEITVPLAFPVIKWIYKILRSIVFAVTLVVVGLYVVAYVLISIPAFNDHIKNIGARELTSLLGGEVAIGKLKISPFNEVVVENMTVLDPKGEKCLEVATLGAGISIWKLISQRKIELTYGEIIGLEACIKQEAKDSALNIGFIIDALKSKDDNKEKTHFELALRNVVLRKSTVKFQRPWMEGKYIGSLNLADLSIEDLCADIAFPRISDTGVEVDLRRLSFSMPGIMDMEKIGVQGSFGNEGINAKDLLIAFDNSRLYIPEIYLPMKEGESFMEALDSSVHSIQIIDSHITPADFSFLFSPLKAVTQQLPVAMLAKGNPKDMAIEYLSLGVPDVFSLNLKGEFNESEQNNRKAKINLLDINLSQAVINMMAGASDGLSPKVKEILNHAGNAELNLKGEIQFKEGGIDTDIEKLIFSSQLMDITTEGSLLKEKNGEINFDSEIEINKLALSGILPKLPVNNLNARISTQGMIAKGETDFNMELTVDNFTFSHKEFDGFSLNADKNGEDLSAGFSMQNQIGDVDIEFSAVLQKNFEPANTKLQCSVEDLNLSYVADMKNYRDYLISGNLSMEADFIDKQPIAANLLMNDMHFSAPDNSKSLELKDLHLNLLDENHTKLLTLDSDWIESRIEGTIDFKYISRQVSNLLSDIFPALTGRKEIHEDNLSDISFQATVKNNNSLPEFFNLPIRLLVPVNLEGEISGSENKASLAIDLPYLQQGRDKLIYDSRLFLDLNGTMQEMEAIVETTMPVKRGDLQLKFAITGDDNHLTADIDWINTLNSSFNGTMSISGDIDRNPLTLHPEFTVDFKKSVLSMGEAVWTLNPATIIYKDSKISIDGLKLWHDDQFVEIDGVASKEYEDYVTIRLADIDVDYIFDMLQINYVTFGGTATGKITGHALLSGEPVAKTDSLSIKDFSYNGCVLGNCIASSRWNNEQKEIEIEADISNDGLPRVKGAGGIWLGRDSLSFALNAYHVPVEFVQPFMAAFSSHVGGFATGEVNLFGTFKDIDMTGRIFADSVAVKLDYTNTVYHGSDSVIMHPGRIEIPSFRLYDKNGKSAILTGELTHRYFHEPSFTFRLSEAEDFLCYDTNADLNPDWYGVLYGSGSALLSGVPGQVDISADMTISGNSSFSFVLNDLQYAQNYQFLTFTDRRAEEKRILENKPVDFKELFRKKVLEESNPSNFGIDIRASVTPAVLFTLVMDPAAGDKITARGRGAIQVKYASDNDEMQMYGKYEITEGNYNFSLQDIILRDFKIKEGSYITFNGNPLLADLDISAAYRVNTNLSDLDKSFSSDRDLARTNVPVDAILSVNGNMQSPDISFDIELPTLTQDVERKVKSIISTDDMMNRQIIYLLALNRFYTPEYMGSSGNGGEIAAAVASSTISSQLSNMLGQLTDKVSVAPSFRSDKGDFSDIEVDVALSSRLLNNRLLINGNFGYRDKSNSSTTFVGDFDVEYLLNKNGNLRLKAYNHFNDQNYYLREALTTQGLGVVWRKDFDD